MKICPAQSSPARSSPITFSTSWHRFWIWFTFLKITPLHMTWIAETFPDAPGTFRWVWANEQATHHPEDCYIVCTSVEWAFKYANIFCKRNIDSQFGSHFLKITPLHMTRIAETFPNAPETFPDATGMFRRVRANEEATHHPKDCFICTSVEWAFDHAHIFL